MKKDPEYPFQSQRGNLILILCFIAKIPHFMSGVKTFLIMNGPGLNYLMNQN